jgi:hypothetical protein
VGLRLVARRACDPARRCRRGGANASVTIASLAATCCTVVARHLKPHRIGLKALAFLAG